MAPAAEILAQKLCPTYATIPDFRKTACGEWMESALLANHIRLSNEGAIPVELDNRFQFATLGTVLESAAEFS